MVKISRRRLFYALVGLAMLTAIITPTLVLVNNDGPIDGINPCGKRPRSKKKFS